MLVGVSIIAIIVAAVMWLKDALDKPVPAENWANEELIWQDMQNGMSIEQQIRYLKKGRYKMRRHNLVYMERKNDLKAPEEYPEAAGF